VDPYTDERRRSRTTLDNQMDLLRLPGESLKAGKLQRRVAAQRGILAGVQHRQPHQLRASRRGVLQQNDVSAVARPAPTGDVTGDRRWRHPEIA
jgi:hypothetical protein